MKIDVMKQSDFNAEQCFMDVVQQAQVREFDSAPPLRALEYCLANLLQAWQAPVAASLCAPKSVVAQELSAIQEQMQASPGQWTTQWDELKPALNMADAFADKLMFLVFGKFNAGTSSFCNLLVERFVAQGLPAEYFELAAGEIQTTSGPFKEGTTETTAHIQGAILANRVVFIDTPGLHSVTQENADLTQRFLDSADAVLWLSSSTSPGQVQELEELALEIRRRKPLMPIITRSDFLDEDIVDNEIVNILCNKSHDNRALQEADVLCRAQDKLVQLGLDPRLIKPPLSVSAYAARSHGLTEQALDDAGIYRFYQAVTQMIAPLLDYKAKKPLAMYVHHLEENVLSDVAKVCQALATYADTLRAERSRLKALTEQLSESIWREIVSHILRLLDDYFAALEQTSSLDALQLGLIDVLAQEYQSQVEQSLGNLYVLPSHLLAASEFNGALIQAYFKQSKTLRVDEFEKIYLSLESLAAKQIQENLQNLQQFVDVELEKLQQDVEQRQAQLQQLTVALQAQFPL